MWKSVGKDIPIFFEKMFQTAKQYHLEDYHTKKVAWWKTMVPAGKLT